MEKYINKINNRKYLLILFARTCLTSTIQPNQDFAEPLFVVSMIHSKKMLILVRGLMINLLGSAFEGLNK